MRRVEALALTGGFLYLLLPAPAPAQTSEGVGIVTTITGVATVARAALPQPLPLRFKDSVFERDRISTAQHSIVRVLLGGKALVTVRELSVLSITEELGRSTVDLQSGKIALGVARQRMRPGEAIEVRTPNAVAAVRGTVLVVEILQASADASGGPTPPTTNVHVLHGTVTVSSLTTPTAPPVTVTEFQTYSQTGGALGILRDLTPTGVTQLLGNLHASPQFGGGSSTVAEQIATQEQSRTTAAFASTAAAALGAGPGGGLPGADPTTQNRIQQPPIIPPIPPPPQVKQKTATSLPPSPVPPPPGPQGCSTLSCARGR